MPKRSGRSPDDLAHRDRKLAAVIRHNLALQGHTAKPMSNGDGIVLNCECGTKATVDGYRDHLLAICRDTPVRVPPR
jgi:hypothetical protein